MPFFSGLEFSLLNIGGSRDDQRPGLYDSESGAAVPAEPDAPPHTDQVSSINIPPLDLSLLSSRSRTTSTSKDLAGDKPDSPRPSSGKAIKKQLRQVESASKNMCSAAKAKGTKRSSSARRPSIATSPWTVHPLKSQERLNMSQRYTEPYFELNGEYSFGCADKKRAQSAGGLNFQPNATALKKEGGKSIELYENWRIMQYEFNIVMKKFMANHGVNASVLPPCTSYEMWRDVEWRNLYKQVTGRTLDEDPCPDCDVRFFKDKAVDNKYTFKVAAASILNNQSWPKRKFLSTVFIIGLPQHITVATCREHSDHVLFEFFDPAGADADNTSVKAVKQWAMTFLRAKYSSDARQKEMIFSHVVKSVNCQVDKKDVMCQTWIWYWVYWRMVRQANANELVNHIKQLLADKKTLKHISRFNNWLAELHRLKYVMRENVIERRAAEKATPKSLEELQRIKHNRDTGNLTASTITFNSNDMFMGSQR